MFFIGIKKYDIKLKLRRKLIFIFDGVRTFLDIAYFH